MLSNPQTTTFLLHLFYRVQILPNWTSQEFCSLVNPFPTQALVLTCLLYKSFETTVGKEEIARNEQFLLFPQCFLPIWRAFCHFQQIQNCRLHTLSVWKSLKFVVWERVKS